MTENMMATINAKEMSIEEKLEAAGLATVEAARAMLITNQSEYESAAKFLTEIKGRAKEITDYWKPAKDAAHKAHQSIVAKEKAMLAPMNEAEKVIKHSMIEYQTAVEKARREAEAEARKRQQEEAERMLNEAVEAESKGDAQGAAIGLAMAEMISEMPTAVAADAPKANGTSVTKTWKARVIDSKKVPVYVGTMEIRPIDMGALNAMARMSKGTMQIDGVEFYEEMSISARKG